MATEAGTSRADAAASVRPRLVLLADFSPEGAFAGPAGAAAFEAALSGGDVAAAILRIPDDGAARADAERLVRAAQAAGAAALIDGPDGLAATLGADGVHVENDLPRLERLLAGRGDAIVGGGGFRSRHDALLAAEAGADYVSFGRLDMCDRFPEPHPRALEEAAWWAATIETPALLLGGNDLAALPRVAGTGAEFVGYGAAIRHHADGPAAAVGAIDAALDAAAAAGG